MTPLRLELEKRRMRFIERFRQEKFHGPTWAKDFGVSRHTMYLWRRTYLQSGELALKATLAKGRPRRLSWQQEKLVQQWLADPDSPVGPNWTPLKVREVMGTEFGVWYHPCHLYKLLARWGWAHHLQS